MPDQSCSFKPLAFLRLQSWFSPAFPVGSYSYSHGLEWAVEAAHVHDRKSLVDWLEADLRYGSGRNEAILFSNAWHCIAEDNRVRLLEIAEMAAVFRSTAEFVLESSQQGIACLTTLSQVWSDPLLDWFAERLRERQLQPGMAVVFGIRSARQGLPLRLSLPVFLQSYTANFVTAAVRLVPLGQTDGQLAIVALEEAALLAAEEATNLTIDDLGSAGIMVDLASMAHETQYTRLFRS
jgi:urease accessory protein